MVNAYRFDVENHLKYYKTKRNSGIFLAILCIIVAVGWGGLTVVFFNLAPASPSTFAMVVVYIMSGLSFLCMCVFLWFAFDDVSEVMDAQKNMDNLALSLKNDELL